jgi:hypothetical protein
MRPLLAPLPALVALLAAAACGGAGAGTAAAPAWRPAPQAPNVECRWDPHVESTPGAALEAACARDPACGCATLGHALLMASQGAVDARALSVLDGACHRGVLVSCDEASLVAEMCVRGTARASSACDVLAQQGRLPKVEPPSAPPTVEGRPVETGIERAPVTAPQPN